MLRAMFELLTHAVHMKAHFAALLPEENHHDYGQVHMTDNPDGGIHICSQFQHCESNVFATAFPQADHYDGWYSTDQSGWLGADPNLIPVGQYAVDDQPYGGVDDNVAGEKAIMDRQDNPYYWGPFQYPGAGGNAMARGLQAAGKTKGGKAHGGYPYHVHPMGCWAMKDKLDGSVY